MRRTTSALLAAVIVPTVLALPTLPRPAARPHPVAPTLHTIMLAAGGPLAARAESAAERTARFSTVAVTWARPAARPDLAVSVRTHTRGHWTGWASLGGPDDVVANGDSVDGRRQVRGGTSPLYAGPSDGVQVRVDRHRDPLPRDLRVDLIDPGSSAADATLGQDIRPGNAQAYQPQPALVRRSQWGADEHLRRCFAGYTATVRVGFVHHTASPNGYSAGEAASMVRGIYAYHVLSNGWCDIGYNYLVDAYGRIYEGRWGGSASRNVMGAHTGGFNTDSFGTSLLGDFTKITPPAAMMSSLARLEAWKLGRYYRNPLGKDYLTAASGSTRYRAGTRVHFNVISGHRDADLTACPGGYVYARLGSLRTVVRAYMGMFLYSPRVTRHTVPLGSTTTMIAGVSPPSSYRLTTTSRCGAPVGSATGSTTGLITRSWRAPRAGRFTLTLSAGSALPYRTGITVPRAANRAPPTGVTGPPGPAGFVPITPYRLFDTRRLSSPLGTGGRLDVRGVGTRGVPSTGVSAVVVNLTGVCPSASTWLAAVPGGVTSPATSSLNIARGEVRAALVTVPIGAQGMISVYNRFGFVDVVGDVVGYFPAGAGSRYHPRTPLRIMDTRRSGSPGPLRTRETRLLPLGPATGVPSGANGVVLNVTAVDGSGGYLTVWPYGVARPGTSSLNVGSRAAVTNRVVSGLRGRQVAIYNSGGPVNLVVDLVGWFAPAAVTGGAAYYPVRASRVLDTRTGLGGHHGVVTGRSSIPLQLAGAGRVVPAGAKAVVMTLTGTGATGTTFVTAYPSDVAWPGTSDLNISVGATRANLLVVPLSASGAIRLYSGVSGVQLIGDVLGYFR